MAKKSSDQVFELSVVPSGTTVVQLKGEILSFDKERGLEFKHKKPRSSKFLISHFTVSQIVFVSGKVGDTEAKIGVLDQAAEIFGLENVSSIKELGNGLMHGTTPDGPVTWKDGFGKLVAQVDGPTRKGRPPKDASAKTEKSDKKKSKKEKKEKKKAKGESSWD